MTNDDVERDLKICAAATAPPWDWFGNTKTHEISLATVDRGRVYVMDFDRWGMSNGQPRFQIDHVMRRLGDLGKDEHPMGPMFEAPHRRQFRGIGHPDARLIVAACNGYEAALHEVQRLRGEAAPRLNPGPTLHGSTITEIAAERDRLRTDLVAMTAARDELGAIARHMYAVADGNEADDPRLKERIAALRAVGTVVPTPTAAQLCNHDHAYECHECEASRCVACDVKVASRSDHVKVHRVCPRCL